MPRASPFTFLALRFLISASLGNRTKPGEKLWGYRHLGIYVYRRDFLLKFSRLRPVPLEQTEGLEQLRALTHGYGIRVVEVDEPSVEVDTPEDLERARTYRARERRVH